MIVVTGGIKGGSGKTTIATNLTVMLSSNGKKVLLVDADDQGSSSSWAQQREDEGHPTPWVTIKLSKKAVRTEIQKMEKNYDHIIIDTGGRDTDSQRYALTIADVYLIPFKPRSLDIWTIGDVKSIVSEVSTINEKLKAYALINMGDSVGVDNNEAMEILKDCPYLTCLPFIVGHRKAFANAASCGMGVSEMKVQDKKAILEIQNIYNFLYHNDIIKVS